MIHHFNLTDLDSDQLSLLKIDKDSIKNDFFDYSKVIVRKPWGYEYLIFSNEHVAIWILSINPDSQTSMHCHPNKSTSLIVLQGQVTVSGLDKNVFLKAGHGIFIDQKVFHQSSTSKDTGAMLMEIESPVNKRDLLRLKDSYGRVNLGYEGKESYTSNTSNYNYLSFKKFGLASGLTKNFLESSLSFISAAQSNLKEIIDKLNDADVLAILNGSLVLECGQVVISPGEMIKVGQLRSSSNYQVLSQLELVIVRSDDHLIKASDFLASFLVRKGIKKIFAVPGEANIHILDSVGRYDGLEYVVFQNEKSAAYAVEASIKLTNKPGVLLVSSGAAGISALQGLADAWVDSIPLIIISGQSRLDQGESVNVRQSGNKSIKIDEIARPLAKFAVKVTDLSLISQVLEDAWEIACSGRPGPVWVDIPLDIQSALMSPEGLTSDNKKKEMGHNLLGYESEFEVLAHILREAKRPVVLVGGGVRRSDAVKEFTQFAEVLGAPVLTSRQGADIFDNYHELYFGRPGGYGQRRANLIMQNCDVLISIGCRLTIPLTGRNIDAFARQSKKVIIDIDPLELNRDFLTNSLKFRMDAKDFLKTAINLIPKFSPQFTDWNKQCAVWSERFPYNSYSGPSLPPDPIGRDIYPIFLINNLSEALNDNDIIVSDGGATLIYVTLAMKFKRGQRFICSTGLEPIGFALPGSIGLAIEDEISRVICICDDRGLQNVLGDLRLIRDYRLPIKIMVLKNNGDSIIRNVQRDFFGGRFVGTDQEIRYEEPPMGKIAELYGLKLFELNNADLLATTITQWLEASSASILMVDVADDQESIPRPSFKFTEDLQWHPNPLEEQLPRLDRAILIDNMLIDLLEN